MSNATTNKETPTNANATATANATAAKEADKKKLNELFEKLASYYDNKIEMFNIDKLINDDYFKDDKIINLFHELNKSNNYSEEGNKALYKIKRYLSDPKENNIDEKINVFKELCTASENLISTAP